MMSVQATNQLTGQPAVLDVKNKYPVVSDNSVINTGKTGVGMQDTASFSGNQPAKKSEKKGSTGNAIASFFVPGLGQVRDGRTKDGLKHVGLFSIGLCGIGGGIVKCAMDGVERKNSKAGLLILAAGVLGTLASMIWSATDAYKGGNK